MPEDPKNTQPTGSPEGVVNPAGGNPGTQDGSEGSTSKNAGDGLSGASNDDLIAEIKKLRAEAASKRVDAKKAKTELQQFEEWKRSQMSESERLKADLEAAQKSATNAYIEVFADKYNVPEERRQFISGSTKEEVENACRVLGEPVATGSGETGAQTAKPSNPNLFPGTRGAPVGSKNSAGATDFDSILRRQLSGR